MNKLVNLATALFLGLGAFLLVAPSEVRGEQESPLYVAVVDNSAALQDVQEAEPYKLRMLHSFTELRRKHGTKGAEIIVVSVNDPRELFVGSPISLFRNARALTAKLPAVNGCSDLVGALKVVKFNIEKYQPEKVRVYVFSSLIHSGAPCDGANITLPQEVPEDVDLQFLRSDNVTSYWLWVDHRQVEPWTNALKDAGVRNFELHGVASTQAFLEHGLGR